MSNIELPSIENLYRELFCLIRRKLWLQILIGFVLGIGCGIVCNPDSGLFAARTSNTIVAWLALPGQLFLSLIQMIIIPLIVSSIIVGLTSNSDSSQIGKMGWRIAVYFLCTTTVAIILGVFLATALQPGSGIDPETMQREDAAEMPSAGSAVASTTVDTALSLQTLPGKISAIVPENPYASIINGQMFQVVIFALIFGIALSTLQSEKVQPIVRLLEAIQKVCMRIIAGIMYIAPLAVFGLIAQAIAKSGLDIIIGMTGYAGTVLLGLAGLMVFYCSILALLTRRNPFTVLNQCKELLLLAFSTSSSAAVMPMSIKTANEKLRVAPATSQLVIPLGATVNMDGTALYQAVATVFLAQAYGLQLGLNQLLIVVITAVSASIGTPGTPGVGIVILSVLLKSVGVPPSGIALIIGVDRLLDMARTAVNVTGDITATAVMDNWMRKFRDVD